MEKNYSKILVTGSIGYDIIMDYPDKFINQIQPDKLHQLNLSFVVNNLEKQIGGIATNISYNFSLLSKTKPLILGAVGRDWKELFIFFKKNKIETKGILVDNKLFSATGSVITDIVDNQIWTYCYGASKNGKSMKLDKYIEKNLIVIISANHPDTMLNFQAQAIKLKLDYFYDPGLALGVIPKSDLWQGIKCCRWLVGNDYEIALIEKIFNLSVKQLVKLGIRVITTLGEKGVRYQDKKIRIGIEGYKVKKVVDPTGAGDAWRGGFLAGLIDGRNVVDSLKLGNALASFAVEKYGTINHHPSKKEIEKRANDLKAQSL